MSYNTDKADKYWNLSWRTMRYVGVPSAVIAVTGALGLMGASAYLKAKLADSEGIVIDCVGKAVQEKIIHINPNNSSESLSLDLSDLSDCVRQKRNEIVTNKKDIDRLGADFFAVASGICAASWAVSLASARIAVGHARKEKASIRDMSNMQILREAFRNKDKSLIDVVRREKPGEPSPK